MVRSLESIHERWVRGKFSCKFSSPSPSPSNALAPTLIKVHPDVGFHAYWLGAIGDIVARFSTSEACSLCYYWYCLLCRLLFL